MASLKRIAAWVPSVRSAAWAASLRAVRTALQARRAAEGCGVLLSRSRGLAASFSGSSSTRIHRVVSNCCQLVFPLRSGIRL